MRSSRRNFLVAGIGLPAIASASRSASPDPQAPAKRASDIKFEYRILGKTGLKVTSVGFGCMVTSDGSVVERAADLGITYFDTAHSYQAGNNERMVGAALKGKRNSSTRTSRPCRSPTAPRKRNCWPRAWNLSGRSTAALAASAMAIAARACRWPTCCAS